MKVVVFGANGKVGRLLVDELLKRGHTVRAFVRGDSPFSNNPKLEITTGDIYDQASVERAVAGTDAVMSTLGSWHTPKKDILTVGMKYIIPAMKAAGIQKIVTLTGSGCDIQGEARSISHRLVHLAFSVFAGKILRDGENHLQQLQVSGLDWSTLRSPIMNEKGDAQSFELSNQRPADWKNINRLSIALALADMLETDQYAQQAPFINRS